MSDICRLEVRQHNIVVGHTLFPSPFSCYQGYAGLKIFVLNEGNAVSNQGHRIIKKLYLKPLINEPYVGYCHYLKYVYLIHVSGSWVLYRPICYYLFILMVAVRIEHRIRSCIMVLY